MSEFLKIENLFVKVDKKNILNGVNLSVKHGETHIITGRNGSGKTSFLLSIMGHPKYKVYKGKIFFKNKNITKLETNKRADLGIFLSFQMPSVIEGLSWLNFLIAIYKQRYKKQISVFDFMDIVSPVIKELEIKEDFLNRSVNFGFSGGERKKMEILQLILLKPKLAILDEIDSGLDIKSLEIILEKIKELKNKNKNMSFLFVTHYEKIAKKINADFFHKFENGKIIDGEGDLI